MSESFLNWRKWRVMAGSEWETWGSREGRGWKIIFINIKNIHTSLEEEIKERKHNRVYPKKHKSASTQCVCLAAYKHKAAFINKETINCIMCYSGFCV